jgi:gluconolactonase
MSFQQLASGQWLEGITVDGDTVWYSDVFGCGIRRHPVVNKGEVWRGDMRWIGVLHMNGDGKVLHSCATGIGWIDPATGATGMLVDTIDGKPIPGTNEFVVDKSGRMYFGTVDSTAFERGTTPGPSALYRIDPDKKVTRLTGDLKFTNGVGLSPDEKRLYHCESFVGVFAYDVKPDGSLGEPQMLLEKNDCDGLKVDVQGRIWASGFRTPELVILNPDGSVAGGYKLPAKACTNHHFAGKDGRDIYMTCVVPVAVENPEGVEVPTEMNSTLWRGRTEVAGLPLNRPHFKLG